MNNRTHADPHHLVEKHRQRVALSGIDPQVARARAYHSVETKADLKRLGFTETQCHVPALVLPV
jgi:hypothetical protein